MVNTGLYSSNTDEWYTPQPFFDALNNEFHFTLDACATPDNAKCPQFYTRQDDALLQDWHGRVWMNPPYGSEIPKWIRKAYRESQRTAEVVVCLLPARTDTAWWHDYCAKAGPENIRFVRGRIKFGGAKWNAPFPSAIVIFRNPTLDAAA